MAQTLRGKRIALAEARELDLLAGMLEREGATVVRCPLVAINDAPDPAPVEAWLRRVVAGKCDDVIFYTGEGMRRLAGFADRAGIKAEFIAALARMRKITRGPKPVKALREQGLEPDLTATVPTTDGLIATLSQNDMTGRTVGLQIYGQEPNEKLVSYLKGAGADVDIVAPYVYASDADDARVQRLIGDMAAGTIDAIAFTSSPQIRRLEEVAEKHGVTEILAEAYRRTRVAAVGPVVAEELAARGHHADAMPETAFTMKPLVRAIGRLFA
jgi:uroporphyrinogen-III synthase